MSETRNLLDAAGRLNCESRKIIKQAAWITALNAVIIICLVISVIVR